MLASAREHCSDKNAEKRTLLPPTPPTPYTHPYKTLQNTTLRAVGEKRPQLVSRWWFQSLDGMKMYKLSGAPSARVTKKKGPTCFQPWLSNQHWDCFFAVENQTGAQLHDLGSKEPFHGPSLEKLISFSRTPKTKFAISPASGSWSVAVDPQKSDMAVYWYKIGKYPGRNWKVLNGVTEVLQNSG